MPYTSGPKLGVRSGDSGGSGMGARSRGTPGFPVPPEMQSREAETEPADVDQDDIKESSFDEVVEDVITNVVVVPGIVDKGEPTDVLGQASDVLDLVKKRVVDELMDEAINEETPSGVGQLDTGLRNLIESVVKKSLPLLQKHGFTPSGEIGAGSNGIAYSCQGGKVLKVSTDEDEAKACVAIKGKALKHVVHVTDVFQFPRVPDDGDGVFGIVQEKLQPLSADDKSRFKQMEHGLKLVSHWWEFLTKEKLWDKAREAIQENPDMEEEIREAYDNFIHFQVPQAFAELGQHGIEWSDFHVGNLMKRGNDYVVLDLGASDVQGGRIPPTIEAVTEGVIRLLGEAQADQVGVTIGRFQPFHRGHATMVRELCSKFDKVILIVGGLKKDERNPFPFKLRERMIKESIPDCISKVEIHEARFEGKNSGFVPGILSDIVKQNDSTLKKETAVHVLVGQDRLADMKGQMARAIPMRDEGKLDFDPSVAEVTAIPNVSEDGDGRISGTAIRQALAKGDEEAVKKMMDPHLVSNPDEFQDIYAEMREAIGAKPAPDSLGEMIEAIVRESLAQAGGLGSVEETLDQVQDKLQRRRPFPVRWGQIHALGSGKDGIAYDMGGNKVFKVTTDPGEAMSSHMLIGKPSQSIVHVFDAFQIPKAQGTQGSRVPLYGIVTEKLAELSSTEKKEFDEANAWIMDPAFKSTTRARFVAGDWPGTLKTIEGNMIRLFQAGEISEQVSEAGEETAVTRVGGQAQRSPSASAPKPIPEPGATGRKMNLKDARLAAQRKLAGIKATLEKFNMPAISKELVANGITFYDYHSGNLMKRGSSYVINDLGHSESKAHTEPPMLERLVREIVMNELGAFTGPGNFAVGAKAGMSAWSGFRSQMDPDGKELWQNQLKDLNVQVGSGSLPDTLQNEPKSE